MLRCHPDRTTLSVKAHFIISVTMSTLASHADFTLYIINPDGPAVFVLHFTDQPSNHKLLYQAFVDRSLCMPQTQFSYPVQTLYKSFKRYFFQAIFLFLLLFIYATVPSNTLINFDIFIQSQTLFLNLHLRIELFLIHI